MTDPAPWRYRTTKELAYLASTDRPAIPVVYHHDVLGSASTERGALGHARRISKLRCEHHTARLAERLDGSLAWFVGIALNMNRSSR